MTADTFLDIGCGHGEFTVILAKAVKAREIFGIDVVRKRLPPSITFIDFNLEELKCKQLPLESDYFQLVSAIEIIEHLSFGDYLLREIKRVLKPKGFLIISTPNLASLLNRLMLLFGYQPLYTSPSKFFEVGGKRVIKKQNTTDFGHKNLFTVRALKHLIEINQFKIIAVKGGRSKYDPLHWLPLTKVTGFSPNTVILAQNHPK